MQYFLVIDIICGQEMILNSHEKNRFYRLSISTYLLYIGATFNKPIFVV